MLSVKYHKIFDYDLVKSDFPKWQYRNEVVKGVGTKKSRLRVKRERYADKKLKIAKKASKLIKIIPSVLFVGVTGSLAMRNSDKDSDIDLIIISKKDTLWTTRLFVRLTLLLFGIPVRTVGKDNEKDELCLNIWLDESALVWSKKDRNIYTAHEIAQIMPLFNKNETYEGFLFKNNWILDYWPKAVQIKKVGKKGTKDFFGMKFVEYIAYSAQKQYMKKKITREVVTPTHALFHPTDWGSKVIHKLKQ